MFKHVCSFTLSCALSAAVSGQTIIYVDDNSSNTAAPSNISNPGSTWTGGTGAFKYLPDGIERANQIIGAFPTASVQIWVADGTYYPDEGHDSVSAAIRRPGELQAAVR